MERRLEAQMFGTLTIRRPDGTVVDHWVRPTGRRLLCLILLSPGRSLTRAQVARTLFPEADANAPNALAKAIHWCRQALGAPWHEHLVSDGGTRPYRAHFRDPSFNNLQATSIMCEGSQVADVIVAVASIDPVMGGVDR